MWSLVFRQLGFGSRVYGGLVLVLGGGGGGGAPAPSLLLWAKIRFLPASGAGAQHAAGQDQVPSTLCECLLF